MRIIKKILKIVLVTIISMLVLFSVLPYIFSVDTKELAKDEKPFPNSKFITVGQTKIHYRIWKPEGKATRKVLLIHGFSASTFSYRNNIDALVKRGAFVIAMDLPAFGFSDKSDTANYSVDNTFSAINQLMSLYDTTCSGGYVLVGHSMGAMIAGTYASNFPEKVKSVVLVDGVPFKQQMKNNKIFGAIFRYPPLLRWANVSTKHYFGNAHKFNELVSSAYGQPADAAAVNGYLLPFTYKNSGSAIFRMFTAENNFSFKQDVFNSLNTLIIWGKNDTWLPLSMCTDFCKENTKPRVSLISGAGHSPIETHYKEVNPILYSFVFSE